MKHSSTFFKRAKNLNFTQILRKISRKKFKKQNYDEFNKTFQHEEVLEQNGTNKSQETINLSNTQNQNNLSFLTIQTCPEQNISPNIQEIINFKDIKISENKGHHRTPTEIEIKKKPRHAKIPSMCLYERNNWNFSEIIQKNYSQNEKSEKNNPPEQCLICFSSQPNAVLMECGHGGICTICALDLWKQTSECFLCRNKISSFLEIEPQNGSCQFIKVISETYLASEQVKK